MGKGVMPSMHNFMKVNFARRREDGCEVVVKIRYKPYCFRSREDERSWRHNTQFLLNMTDNSVARFYEVLEDICHSGHGALLRAPALGWWHRDT
mmetsp:Transcript_40156/g.93303  ORF Transcript_40156/g.93303 Transcript_40156/m.93303 type:complete len:94 (-) Transcript_40156:108-389(-)